MNTPILKAEKGKTVKEFYNEGEFEEWKKTNDVKGWRIKYYKGLGTSTSKEFKEYFQKKKIVSFKSTGEESSKKIDMVFNKKRSDDRKEWLANYNRELYLDTSKSSVTYEEFINNDPTSLYVADSFNLSGLSGIEPRYCRFDSNKSLYVTYNRISWVVC